MKRENLKLAAGTILFVALFMFCIPALGPLLGKFLNAAVAFWETIGVLPQSH